MVNVVERNRPAVGFPRPMTIDEIRKFYDAQRFHPLVIHMAGGREIPAHGRHFMAPGAKGRTIHQPGGDPDHSDLLSLTGMEVRPATRGAWRRKR